MTYNVDLEVCAVLFLVLLCVISQTRKKLEGYQSMVFQIYLYLVLASNVLDIVATSCLPYYDTLPAWINWGINAIFLTVQMSLPVIFVMYIYRKLPSVTLLEKRLISACCIPAAVGQLLCLTSPLHHLIFYFNETGYHHGSMHIYLYTNVGFYMAMAIYLAIRWRKIIGWREFPLLFTMIGIPAVSGHGSCLNCSRYRMKSLSFVSKFSSVVRKTFR